MLEEIRIQGLGVIDDAVLPLSSGFTVLTGETGAGKTMVVQGLALLFGGRADSGRIRPGEQRALVEGRLVLAPDHPAVARAAEAGAEDDDGALVVARSVSVEGRSRAHVGGRSVPMVVLAEIGEEVLALHGQSDQQRLLSPARQREALDRFAGQDVLASRAAFASGWARLGQLREELAGLRTAAQERALEAQALRLGLVEIEQVAPAPGEDRELRAEIERLSHVDALGAGAADALAALVGHDNGAESAGALAALSSAQRSLGAVHEHDQEIATLSSRAMSLLHELTDLGHDVAGYLASVDHSPGRLAQAQERLAALTTVVRRHAVEDVDGLLRWVDQAGRRLMELDSTGDTVDALSQEQAVLTERLAGLAHRLTELRQEAAGRFSDAVSEELTYLAMPDARVVATVSQRAGEPGLLMGEHVLQAGPHGVDSVELLLVPHQGAPARSLAKGASGGELSRVMLAVEVVFAGSDPVPVMVFDEVDAGIGGAAAIEVGRRLARLARSHQVIVVTHLPQVAAFADQHLRVHKHTDGSALTRGDVEVLSGQSRVGELSRMLAGLDSGVARAHAEELLELASGWRADLAGFGPPPVGAAGAR